MFKQKLLVTLFSSLLIVLPIIDAISPINVFSSLENRYLSGRPLLRFDTLKDGSFMKNYENYIDDQIVKREAWMEWKAKLIHYAGIKENNNVLFGEEDYLFEKFLDYSSQYDKNYYHIMTFAMKHPTLKKDFILAPNSYEVLSDLLPFGHLNIDQEELIHEFYEAVYAVGVEGINVLEALKDYAAHDEKLYYKLDHHWTSLGAFVAYSTYCHSLGLKPVSLEELEYVRIPDFFGSLVSAAKRSTTEGDSIDVYAIPNVTVFIEGTEVQDLYDFSYATKRDKYGLFLHNNPGRLTIHSEHPLASNEKIIVFKDSYANSFLPFLSMHYSEIDVIDLRYFNGSVEDLIASGSYDRILFLYNVINFTKDTHIIKLNN